MPITHVFVSPVADAGDPNEVGPNEWNDDHTLPTAAEIGASPTGHTHTHAAATGQTGDDHHDEAHAHDGADGSGTVGHADTTGQTPDDHHTENHQARHNSGGADALKLDDLATPDDNTDLNASAIQHGLLPKLSNVVTEFLNGQGAFSTPAGGGDVATDAIFDALGDLVVGSGANAASRLAKGAEDTVLRSRAAEALDLGWDSPVIFKKTELVGNTNKTTTSTTFVAIDTTNLAYLTLSLAIGDVVRCKLQGQAYNGSNAVGAWDFEVDQPASADTRCYPAAENGAGIDPVTIVTRVTVHIEALFTATEAGVHGFRPMWRTTAGTLTLANGTSGADDTAIIFTVEKLGAPRA